VPAVGAGLFAQDAVVRVTVTVTVTVTVRVGVTSPNPYPNPSPNPNPNQDAVVTLEKAADSNAPTPLEVSLNGQDFSDSGVLWRWLPQVSLLLFPSSPSATPALSPALTSAPTPYPKP